MNFKNLKLIFTEATTMVSSAARNAYLDEVCAGNPALRSEVESLLAAQSRLGDFLQPESLQSSAPPTDATGTCIGPYNLLEKIGEGGFGIVYMAQQEQPIRRKVALKVIKAGMDTKQVIARFEVERQALALMDHPHIARVLDGGETQDGRPFFVMELVRGRPITEYCEQEDVRIRERLKLFIQVTNAVQHAHQKGIIHRDLKPSNVMITLIDGAPVPKVIDFGVAKAGEQRLAEKMFFTRYGQMIGTPAYMSPEQAELSGQDVDTRSDIYSLGCLLYELLTGTAPLENETLRQAGFDEIRRLIRETDPPTPSTRVRQIARAMASNAADVPRPTLRSTDLDWIVMKCLEKDRSRRYATASDLAADLEHFLGYEPVTARPPSQMYRLTKFARRHRLQVIFISGVSLVIITGLVFALIGFAKARQERDRALAAKKQASQQQKIAETEAVRSAEIARFLETMLTSVKPKRAQGYDTTLLREILDETSARLPTDLAGQPEVEAKLRQTLGGVYQSLGEPTNAATMHREAVRLLRKVKGNDHLDVAKAIHSLADLHLAEEKYPEAEELFREALAIRVRLLGNDHRDVASTLRRLVVVLAPQGGSKLTEAREKAVAVERLTRQHVAASRSSSETNVTELINDLRRLSLTLQHRGEYPEVESIAREIVVLARRIPGDNRKVVASALDHLTTALQAQGKDKEAETASAETLALWREVEPAESESLHHLMVNRASLLKDVGRFAEAETLLREALGFYQTIRPDPQEAAAIHWRLAENLIDQKRHAEAEPLLLVVYQAISKSEIPPRGSSKHAELCGVLGTLVNLYTHTGRTNEADHWRQKQTELAAPEH